MKTSDILRSDALPQCLFLTLLLASILLTIPHPARAGSPDSPGANLTISPTVEPRIILASQVSKDEAASTTPSITSDETSAPSCPDTFTGRNEPFTCLCPATKTNGGNVWGTKTYTDGSNLCVAAVHDGSIDLQGGLIHIIPAPGESSYAGSTFNGITSNPYGGWPRSFQFAARTEAIQAQSTTDASAPESLSPARSAIVRDLLAAYSDNHQVIELVADNADYALLALGAYSDQAALDAAKERGWSASKNYVVENRVAGDTVATLFVSDGVKHVLAFRGTDPLKDWVTNLLGSVDPTPILTAQIDGAREIAKEVAALFPDVVFVGHSLGGRLAEVARLETGKPSAGFNVAPLGLLELTRWPTLSRSLSEDILRFRGPDDPLSATNSTRHIEVKNIFAVNAPIATGINTLLDDTTRAYTHGIAVLAAAMQDVRIARDEGWIASYQLAAPTDSATVAKTGCALATVQECLDKGIEAYEKGNYNEALRELRPLAEQGNAKAQFTLGIMYYKRKGVAQDNTEALKWFHKAAEQGDADAQTFLGAVYSTGDGVAQNYTEAAKWYHKAAEQGDAGAQFLLGTMYNKGQGVAQDYTEAVKWYLKAAEQGNAFAQNYLGAIYAEGKGVAQDYAEAVKWFRMAADQGQVFTQNLLGSMYAEGQRIAQDYTEAVKWYRMAAEQGYADAQFNLGIMYEKGLGVPQDYTEAVKWFRAAAAEGNQEASQKVAELEKQAIQAQRDLAQKEWTKKWDAILLSKSPVENIADIIRHNKSKVIQQFAQGRQIVIKAGEIEFAEGKIRFQDFHAWTDIYKDIVVPKGKFSWDTFFEKTQNSRLYQGYFVHCIMNTSEAGNLVQDQVYTVHAELISLDDSKVMFKCSSPKPVSIKAK